MARRADTRRSSTLAWLVLAGIAVLSLVGFLHVLKLRFESADHYPSYSTLRADPMGMRGLFESLGKLPGVKVERNFMPLKRLEEGPQQTLVLQGMTSRAFNSPYWMDTLAVSRFAAAGGRVVIALSPDESDGRVDRVLRRATQEAEDEDRGKSKKDPKKSEPKDDKKEAKAEPKKKDNKKAHVAEAARDRRPSFAETLRITAQSREFFYSGKGGAALDLKPALPLKQDEVPEWMSNVFLNADPKQQWRELSDDYSAMSGAVRSKAQKVELGDKTSATKDVQPSPWTELASKGDRIMMAERKLGSGSVVACTDRYFLSNESLWTDPKPAFIAWLIGDAKKVIFDETHLGEMVGDEEGIMTLARRHGMHGLFLGGILLFGLFIWRSAISLVPSNPDDDLGSWRGDAVAGRSSASGLEGLLRRGFPTKGLLRRCFEVWEQTRSLAAAVPTDRRDKARKLMEGDASTKNAVATFRAIRDTLHPPR